MRLNIENVLKRDLLHAEMEFEGTRRRCCGNTTKRRRKVLINLNSPGYAAQEFYSEFQSLNVVQFYYGR